MVEGKAARGKVEEKGAHEDEGVANWFALALVDFLEGRAGSPRWTSLVPTRGAHRREERGSNGLAPTRWRLCLRVFV